MQDNKLKELKTRNPITEVARNLDFTLRGYEGNTQVTRCFNHEDKKPSLVIMPKVNRFKCSSCEIKGDVIELVKQVKGLDFKGAVSWLDPTYFDQSQPIDSTEYLRRERGINKKTQQKFKLRCEPNKIVIPLPTGEKYRWLSGEIRYSQKKGTSGCLYKTAEAKEFIILTEGEFDALILLQETGYPTWTGTAGVGAFKKEWLSDLKGIKKIYLAFDADVAGDRAATELARKIGGDKSYRLRPPKGKDWTDYFVKHKKTRKDFDKLLKKAELISGESEEADDQERGKEKKRSVAAKLFSYVLDQGVEVMLDQTDVAHFILPEKPTVAFPIKGSVFRRWLAGVYWAEEEKGISGGTFLDVVEILKGKAFHEGNKKELFNRIAKVGNVIYYDLGDDERVVKITDSGWEITSDCPVFFRRFNHQQPQVDPVKGGDLKGVLEFINLRNPTDQLLFLTYLVAVFIPDIPRPVIIGIGDQGAAKSTGLRVTRSLIDPSITELLSPPRDVNELAQNANHHYSLFLDNLSSLPEWFSDVLCRLSTGIGFSKRRLFTDDEDILFTQKVAIGITGINLVAEKPDLLDRSLILRFEAISEEERIAEEDFWKKFSKVKGRLLGGLFAILSETLRIAPTLSLKRKPRMADYAKYAVAAAVALGYSDDEFLSAFNENVSRQNQAAVESSPVAQVVLEFMEDEQEWSGSSTELYDELFKLAEEAKLKIGGRGGFPSSSNWLWKKIKQVRPNLIALGVMPSHDENKTSSVIELVNTSKDSENTATTPDTATLGSKKGGSIKKEKVDTATNSEAKMAAEGAMAAIPLTLENEEEL